MGIRDDEEDEDTKVKEAPSQAEESEDEADDAPADEDDSEGDDDGEDDSPAAADEPASPAAAPGSPEGTTKDFGDYLNEKYGKEAEAAPGSPEERAKAVQDYLVGKYREAADDSKIKAARDAAATTNNIANFGHAFETLGRANAQAHGSHVGVDDAFYNGMKAQGQQGIQQATDDRQAKISQLMQENAIKQQVVQSMYQRGDIEQKQQALKIKQDLDQKKLDLEDQWKKLQYETSAANTKVKADQVAETAKSRIQVASDRQKDRIAEAESKKSEKTEQRQARSYADLINKAEGARGAPQVVIKSMNSQTAIKNAQELISQYPNLDNMPEQQVHLLASELEKVATNGSGTEAGRQGLNPDTFQQKWNKFMGQVEGKPQGAQISAFIRENAEYLNGLKKVSDGVINKYRENLFAGNKKLIAPEDAKDFQERYAEAFQKPTSQRAPSTSQQEPPAPAYEPGMALGAPAKGPVGPSKLDLEAEMKRRGLLK
jgi:hypothetical protein